MAVEVVSNQIILNDVRIARVSLATPYIGKDAPIDPVTGKAAGKYHIDAILSASHPQLEQFKTLMRTAVQKAFGDQWEVALEKIKVTDKFPLHRGDINRAGKPEYAGLLFISANNDEQPTIVVTENGVNIANRGTPVILTPSHPSWPYAGCQANVQLSVFAYKPTAKNKGAMGVSASVMGVQFYKHNTRLQGSSVSSASEFGLVANSADGAAPSTAASSRGADGLI